MDSSPAPAISVSGPGCLTFMCVKRKLPATLSDSRPVGNQSPSSRKHLLRGRIEKANRDRIGGNPKLEKRFKTASAEDQTQL